MKVSVITVSYNSAATICRTIESVLSQLGVDIEYIVVDGCSTDGTVALLRQYESEIHRLIVEPDDGMYDALNKGIAVASGDIVSILNSDDVYSTHNVLSRVVAEFKRSPSIEAVLGDIEMRDSTSCLPSRKISCRYWAPQMLRFGWMPPHPGMFIRREVYSRIGGFRTGYSIAADYEFSVRFFLVNAYGYQKLKSVVVDMDLGGLSTNGLLANATITEEIQRAFSDNGLKTGSAVLMLRFPIKFLLEIVLFRISRFVGWPSKRG